MSVRWNIVGIVAALVAGTVTVSVLSLTHRPIVIEGAVVVKDSDPKRESPIAGATVSVDSGDGVTPPETATSTFAGYFKLQLRPNTVYGETLTLRVRHPDHQPLDLAVPLAEHLYVIHMSPARPDAPVQLPQKNVVLSDVVVRYTVESRTSMNVGSGARTFQIGNIGNVPCERHPPCSPDGKWKASVGVVSLDAGAGNEFRNARLSCIAGPCPFTQVESDGYTKGGRVIMASVRNWSDTATFALEAEVFRPENTNATQRSYPILLGRGLNFTLAASAAGVSIEAEVDGMPIVFPLPPNGALSWATCEVTLRKDQSRLYRCELKPGFVFKDHDSE